MALAVDSQGNSHDLSISSVTKSFNNVAGNGLFVVVTAYDPTGANRAVFSITYNGVALTKISSSVAELSTDGIRSEIWYLNSPATGTHNLVLTMGGTCNTVDWGWITFSGCDTTASVINASNSGTTAVSNSITVSVNTTVANCFLIGGIEGSGQITIDASSTSLFDLDSHGNRGQYSTSNVGAIGAHGFTNTSSVNPDTMVMSLIAIAPPSGGGAVAPTVQTDSVSSIGTTFATGSGEVTNNGGATVTEFGIVLSTSANPTTANTKFIASGNSTLFSVSLYPLLVNTTYHVRAYAINSAGTGYGADISFTTLQNTLPVQKQYYYKIYNTSLQYVTTWLNDVTSEPNFRTVLNGGPGELTVRLARKYDNFGENVDVALNNRVELWVADNDNVGNNVNDNTLWDTAMWDIDVWDSSIKSFIKIYGGTISAYTPTMDDKEEYVDVTILGFASDAVFHLLKDASGNTTFTYTGQDPSVIMKDLISKYRADGGVNLNYVGNSIQTTGTTVTYKFQHTTLKDALDKLVTLAPDNWYYFIDANGTIFFQQSNLAHADHILTIGKDVLYSQTTKRTENVVNEVSIVGGGNPNLLNIYTRSGSVSTNGKHHRVVQDGQVIDNPTADLIAKRLLDMYQTPETRSIIRVLDNNGENSKQGANIESFQIGDSVQLKNLNYGANGTTLWDQATWDTDVWDYTINYTTASILTIVSIQYYPDYIEIEASSRLPEISKDLQTLNKLITQQAQQNVPTAPTVRVV